MKSSVVAAFAGHVLASLNCTLTAPLKTYCCPSFDSEVVKELPTGALVMTGCAVDDTDKGWLWQYNGLYVPFTPETKNCHYWLNTKCNMQGNTICSNATGIIDYTKGGPGPLDRCNPRCVSENDFPSRTWFGDTIHGVNMASDFPFWVEKFDGDQPNYGGNGN